MNCTNLEALRPESTTLTIYYHIHLTDIIRDLRQVDLMHEELVGRGREDELIHVVILSLHHGIREDGVCKKDSFCI